MPAPSSAASPARLREVALFFLRLGSTAFGGPAAHIALMRAELVTRRGWVSDQEFLDLLGAANLIPGPNSTEMAIHLGYRRAGWPGLMAAGLGFILPAVVIVLGCAWAYQTYGRTPPAEALLYGVQPVILAIVAQAVWALGRTAVKDRPTALVGAAALGLYALGVSELPLLFGGALALLLIRRGWRDAGRSWKLSAAAPLLPLTLSAPQLSSGVDLTLLFWLFAKIGSVLYGSGYVLLAFLRADFVERLGWLTDRQLLDAIAVGQITPGPVFTTATFIGYQLGGLTGALLATAGIFLPAFVFVALSAPFVSRLRASATAGALLDGVNVASLALMAAVTAQLGQAALRDGWTWALALGAGLALFRWKLNPTWLALAGAAAGLLLRWR